MLSRSFHYQLKQSEKTTLLGPPENTREHVVAASRAMLGGDWRRALTLIINDKMNAKVFEILLPFMTTFHNSGVESVPTQRESSRPGATSRKRGVSALLFAKQCNLLRNH